MTTTYDLIVVGAGAMGSAAAYHAAKRGARVLLLEQFALDHQHGSSHGHSRIIRYAYDHPAYVALARAAFADWAQLEAEAGEALFYRTGGLDFARSGDLTFAHTLETLRAAGIAHEVLTPAEAMARFPQFRFDDDMQILYQADAGLLRASRCVLAQVELARRHGAQVQTGAAVTAITPLNGGVQVEAAGEVYSGARMVLAAGGWMRSLLAQLNLDLPLHPLRTHEIYFHPDDPSAYTPERFPAFIGHLSDEYGSPVYGIANVADAGVKIALHGGHRLDHPSDADRTPDEAVVAAMERFAARHLPGGWRRASARVCLYTMTPDEHFLIDHHPQYPQIVIGSPCSGHGFKFSTTIGRILAGMALDARPLYDIDLFRLARLTTQKAIS